MITSLSLKAKASTVALRSLDPFVGAVEIDEEAGIIRNAAVMTIGPAEGHGWSIDEVTIEQLNTCLAAAGDMGATMRFRHPEKPGGESLGTDVGHLRNAHIVGNQVRADVHLGEWAKSLPILGNVWPYILNKAKSDPTGIGLSAVIVFDLEPVIDSSSRGSGKPEGLVARIHNCIAVDFVGRAAANPNGLLSSKSPITPPRPSAAAQLGALAMNETLRNLLCNKYDLAWDSSDEAAQAYYDALTDEQKNEIKGLLDAAAAAATAEAAVATSATVTTGASLAARQTPAKPAARPTRQGIVTDDGDRLLAQEGRRVTQIGQLQAVLKVPDEVAQLSIAAGEDVVQAKKRFLDHLSANAKPVTGVAAGSITVGEDQNIVSLSAGISDAILVRSGTKTFYKFDELGRAVRDANEKPVKRVVHERAAKFASLSLVNMYQHFLVALGAPSQDVFSLSPARVAELMGPRALRRHFPQVAQLAQSTSDFDAILADTMNKTLRQEYLEAERTWVRWARRATNPDFKDIKRNMLSESPALVARAEGQGINYVTLADGKESYALKEYTSGIRLTRRAIVNDDLDAFGRIPKLQAQAAARLEDDVAYAVITNNSAMADTGALFNATVATTAGGHANLVSVTTGIGAISVATVSATELLMSVQRGPKNSAELELAPKFLLVPTSLKTSAQQFVASNVDPSKNNQTPNPYNGSFEVIASTRLYRNNTTAWYLLADSSQIDTVEVCFLQDEPEPVAKQETDFDTEDVRFAIRHTVAAAALDFRGMVKNPGA